MPTDAEAGEVPEVPLRRRTLDTGARHSGGVRVGVRGGVVGAALGDSVGGGVAVGVAVVVLGAVCVGDADGAGVPEDEGVILAEGELDDDEDDVAEDDTEVVGVDDAVDVPLREAVVAALTERVDVRLAVAVRLDDGDGVMLRVEVGVAVFVRIADTVDVSEIEGLAEPLGVSDKLAELLGVVVDVSVVLWGGWGMLVVSGRLSSDQGSPQPTRQPSLTSASASVVPSLLACPFL